MAPLSAAESHAHNHIDSHTNAIALIQTRAQTNTHILKVTHSRTLRPTYTHIQAFSHKLKNFRTHTEMCTTGERVIHRRRHVTARVTELCCAAGAVVSLLCVSPTQTHTITAVLHNQLPQVRGCEYVGGVGGVEVSRRGQGTYTYTHTHTHTLSLQVLAAMLILFFFFCSPSGCCQCKGGGAGSLDWLALSDD